MHLFKTPKIVKWLYPGLTWARPSDSVYLTFDDGPVPEATPLVLDILKTYAVKASFFCVGENIDKHPEVFARVVEEGHTIGNHTYNHLKGWSTDTDTYFQNTKKGFEAIQEAGYLEKLLFRPPYGKATRKQYRKIQKELKCEIVMWEVLTYDFDTSIPEDTCLQNALKNTKKGSIVLFHDSVKTMSKIEKILPQYLAKMQERGLKFAAL